MRWFNFSWLRVNYGALSYERNLTLVEKKKEYIFRNKKGPVTVAEISLLRGFYKLTQKFYVVITLFSPS